MKKLITICLLMASAFTINAQTLRGSCYDNGQGTSSYFTQVDIDATFSFYTKNNSVYIKCSNLKMNVPSNTTYNAYGQTYTKSDLGISQWPQNQKPWSMTINVNGSYNGGNFNKDIFCNVNFTCDEYYIEGIKAEQVNLSSFRITSISNFRYNQGGDPQLEEIIKQKNKQKSQTISSSNTASTSSAAKNPLETSQSSTTQTNSQIPSLESQYAKLGIPANTPTYSKQEVTNQLVTQAGSLANELVNDWNANYDRKVERWKAEADAKVLNSLQKDEDRFRNVYLPLMDLAMQGNEKARMILYFTSASFRCRELVPLREKWFEEALANNNLDALCQKAKIVQGRNLHWDPEYKECIPYYIKAAEMGSVDAQIIVGEYYNHIGEYKLALKMFRLAAEQGSPNAMLKLSYIYGTLKKEKDNEEKKLKYAIVTDNAVAFNWLNKSIQPDYEESLFSKSLFSYFEDSSFFDPKSYLRLSDVYKSDYYVLKDKIKSKEMKKKYEQYGIGLYREWGNKKFKDPRD